MIKKAIVTAFVAAAALAAAAPAARSAQAAEQPATARLKAYIEAFNSGRPERMKEFFEAHFAAAALRTTPVSQRLARYESGRLQLKSFALERVVAERPGQSFLLVRTGGGMDALLGGVVEKEPPHRLLSITLEPVEDPDDIVIPDPKADEGKAEKVTIRHLLSMTSGIGDFFGARYEATPKDKIRSLRDYLPLFADRPLEFEPGTNNRYSNGGYVVLGLIIEKASGRDYYDYVRESIFKPCGMGDTDSYPRDAGVPNLALGYTRREGAQGWTLNHATLPGRGSSAGGGYSTTEDLLRYVRALREGKIVLPDSASGLGIAGGAPGLNASLDWDPRSGDVVIVLTNLDPPAAVRTSRQIRSWLPR